MFMMIHPSGVRLPNRILAEAHSRLIEIDKEGIPVSFPLNLKDAPEYYIAGEGDPFVEPHATIVFGGARYVIGTRLLVSVAV